MVEKDKPDRTFQFKNMKDSLNKIDKKEVKIVSKQVNLIKKDLNKDDYLCSLCLCIYLKPVRTKCNHIFCEYCFQQYVDNNVLGNIKCPFCKTEIVYDKKTDKHDISKDKKIEELLKINFSNEYKSREITLLKELSLIPKHVKVRIAYGNTYYVVENPKKSRSLSSVVVKHGYILYVEQELSNNENKVIDSVEYKLHPTYQVTDYKIKSEPFTLNRKAWGYFTVPIKINLKRGFLNMKNKSKTIEFEHELCFDEGGQRNELILFLIKS